MIVEKLCGAWRAGYAAFRQGGVTSQEAGDTLLEDSQPSMDVQSAAPAGGPFVKTPLTPCAANEAVRIVFLAQYASSWAGWRSIWHCAQRHPQVVAKVLLAPFVHHLASEAATYDALKHAMMEEGIPFHPLAYFDLVAFAPHVVLIQNPYDETESTRIL